MGAIAGRKNAVFGHRQQGNPRNYQRITFYCVYSAYYVYSAPHEAYSEKRGI
jgi:hypothetical protein